MSSKALFRMNPNNQDYLMDTIAIILKDQKEIRMWHDENRNALVVRISDFESVPNKFVQRHEFWHRFPCSGIEHFTALFLQRAFRRMKDQEPKQPASEPKGET